MNLKFENWFKDNFFPYHQTSFFLHCLTLNLYFLLLVRNPNNDQALIPIKQALEESGTQYRTFGYSESSIQNSIRELNQFELIQTEKKARQKYFIRSEDETYEKLRDQNLIHSLAMNVKAIETHFSSLDKNSQKTLLDTLRITKFWEIIQETIDQPYEKEINIGAFNRFSTLQNMHVLGFGEKHSQFQVSIVMTSLYDLLHTVRQITKIISKHETGTISSSQSINPITAAEDIVQKTKMLTPKNTIPYLLHMESRGEYQQLLTFIKTLPTKIADRFDIRLIQLRILVDKADLKEADDLISSLRTSIGTSWSDLDKIEYNIYHLQLAILNLQIDKANKINQLTSQKFIKLKSKKTDKSRLNLLQAKFYVTESHLAFRTGKYDITVKKLDEALSLFESLNNQRQIALTMGGLATAYNYKQDYAKAEELANNAFTILLDLNQQNNYDLGNMRNRQGGILSSQRRVSESTEMFESAITYYKSVNFELGLMKSYGNQANYFRFIGKYDKAIKYYDQSTKLAKKLNYIEIVSGNTINMGDIFSELENPERALEYYDKALELSEDWFKYNQREHARILENIGIAKRKLGEVKSSLEYYSKAEEIYTKIGCIDSIWTLPWHIGTSKLKQGYLIKAKKFYEDAFTAKKLSKESIDDLWTGRLLKSMAIVLYEMDMMSEALTAITKSHLIAKNDQNNAIVSNCLSVKMAIELALGLTEATSATYKELKEIQQNSLQQLDHETVEFHYIKALTSLLIDKENPRSIETIAAGNLYQELLTNGSAVHFDMFYEGRVGTLETLVKKYEVSHDPEVLDKIEIMLKEFRILSEKEDFPKLRVKALQLESLVRSYQGNNELALELNREAQEIALVTGQIRIHNWLQKHEQELQ